MVIVDHHRGCADDIIDDGGGDIGDGGHDEKDGYALGMRMIGRPRIMLKRTMTTATMIMKMAILTQ